MVEHRRFLASAVRDAIAFAENAHVQSPLQHLYAARQALDDSGSHSAPIQVDLVTARVLGTTGPIPLTRAELAIVLLLAIHENGLSRGELLDVLYPEADEINAHNTFKVTLHRVRRRVGSPEVVSTCNGRYVIGSIVSVDLHRIEGQIRRFRRSSPPDAYDRNLFEHLRVRLAATRPEFTREWAWFEATERRLCDLYRDVTALLARNALREDRLEPAIDLAGELCRLDPLDEEATEITIRAFLRLGDRTAAALAYRRYAAEIQNELQLPPSHELIALLNPQNATPTANRRIDT